jgi:hypothetical protein
MQLLQRSWCLSRICSSAIAWRVLCAVVLLSAVCDAREKKQVTFAMDKKHPGQFLCVPEESWVDTATLEFDVVVSNDVPSESQLLVHIKDWDYFWYQKVVPGYLVPGKTNHFRIDMSPDAEGWKPTGHHGAWHFRALMEPKEIGIRVFKDSKYEAACQLTNVFRVASRKDDESPSIETVHVNRETVPCFEKFEITFRLPDRYKNPFDRDEVRAYASFEDPDGNTIQVDAFFARDYYREVDNAGDRVYPQGEPFWCVRYAPVKEGVHKYSLVVRDENGEGAWGPRTLTAVAPKERGFVHVSKKDPRYFEFDDGTFFFPVGHNIRSPFDTRMDKNFPWVQRWPEGSSAYTRYFKDMRENGETLVEVWSASWSLGLEWSPKWRGYHGIGQFNMINAWETDRVVEEAEKSGIYINFVIHNHGKFSSFSDEEWEHNPFNVKNGGYLKIPEEYFTDERALKSYRQLMRYMIARWGYSSHIFAWELWSELDLTGSKSSKSNYKRPEVVDWHRQMGRWIKEVDPNDHMISTHVCADWTHQNWDIAKLPEIDLCPVDAYHERTDPLHIVKLMNQTAAANNKLAKPVLITEFGGQWSSESVKHLDETLHAALWASTCSTLGGTPLFWWWHLIEEREYYPKFLAVSKFIDGEDRRDPEMVRRYPTLLSGTAQDRTVTVQCVGNRERAYGWIYHNSRFGAIDPLGEAAKDGLVLAMRGMKAGDYQIEFWDTNEGKRISVVIASCAKAGAVLSVDVPAFARDIAFKLKSFDYVKTTSAATDR